MSLEYALFLGCVAPIRELGYELSARAVCKLLDIKLVDVADFNCCMPACLVSAVDYTAGLALTARNFCVADEVDLDVLTLCASCYGTLSRAKYLLAEKPDIRREVNRILASAERTYTGKADVKHITMVLYEDIKLVNLRKMVAKPLGEINAAPFYGCHTILPYDYAKFDDPEFPVKLDQLIEATGATSLNHEEKASCCIGCGAFFGGVSEEASLHITERILDSAKKAKADCIVTTCPYCIMQLELGQIRVMEATGKEYNLPVIHYVDLLGLSLGLEPKELGMDLHRVDSTPLLEKIKR